MPKTFGGLIGWLFASLLVVAVGLFILSRIPPVWGVILPKTGA